MIGMFRGIVPLLSLPAALLAHEAAQQDVEQPKVRPVRSAHYEVWSIDGTNSAARAGATLEQLRRDFADTFAGRITAPLPEGPLTALLVRGELAHPGVYDPLRRWAIVDLERCKWPADKWRTILRHEGAHQLFAHTYGIPVVAGDNSFWYREGMACYFEGGGKLRLNGPVRLLRLGTLEAAFGDKVLPPIAELVRRQPGNLGGGNDAVDYALAWSFVHFLLHGEQGAYRDRLLGFFDNIRTWNQQMRGSELFLASFPDLDALHRDWSRHVALLQRGTEAEIAARLAPIGRVPHQPPDPDARAFIPKLPAPAPVRAPGPPEIRAAYALLADIFNGPEARREERLRTELFAARNGLAALSAGYSKMDEFARRRVLEAIEIARHRPALALLIEQSLRDPDPALRRRAAGIVSDFTYGIAPKVYFTRMRGLGPGAMQRVIEALHVIGDPWADKYLVGVLGSVGWRLDHRDRDLEPSIERGPGRTVFRTRTRRLADEAPVRRVGRNTEEQAMAEAAMAALADLTGQNFLTPAEWMNWYAAKSRRR